MAVERVVDGTYKKASEIYSKFKKLHLSKVMFVEAIFRDDVWDKVKKTVGSGYLYFVTTPVNYDLHRVQLNMNMPKEKWEKIILERYNWLKSRGERIELHVHLALMPYMLKYSEQKKKITDAYNWMKKNGFDPKLFIPGWWVGDKNTEKIATNLGLKLMKQAEYWATHDYELI